MSLTSSPHDAESLTLTRTSVPLLPLGFDGRQRQRLFFVSRMRMSEPPVVRSLGAAALAPEARVPVLRMAVAFCFFTSIRQTVALAESSTYGAPSEPRTSASSLGGLSAGNSNTAVEPTG